MDKQLNSDSTPTARLSGGDTQGMSPAAFFVHGLEPGQGPPRSSDEFQETRPLRNNTTTREVIPRLPSETLSRDQAQQLIGGAVGQVIAIERKANPSADEREHTAKLTKLLAGITADMLGTSRGIGFNDVDVVLEFADPEGKTPPLKNGINEVTKGALGLSELVDDISNPRTHRPDLHEDSPSARAKAVLMEIAASAEIESTSHDVRMLCGMVASGTGDMLSDISARRGGLRFVGNDLMDALQRMRNELVGKTTQP